MDDCQLPRAGLLFGSWLARRGVLHSRFVLAWVMAGPALLFLVSSSSPASAACSATVTSLSYGSFNVPNGAAVDTTATVNISCSEPGSASSRICVSINDPSIPMTSGGNSLAQNIYKDAARTALFGSYVSSPSGGSEITISGSGSGTVTLYGRVPVNQNVPAGSYSVTMPATNIIVASKASLAVSCQDITNQNASGVTITNLALTASATAQASCSVTATNMDFGSNGFLTTAKDATSSISLRCTINQPFTVGLNGGNASASNPTQRKMSKGAEQITYGLYRDAGRTQPWGSTINTDTAAGTGSGTSQSLTVYGRVPAQATPSPGTYSDTVVVTVTY